MTEKGLECPLYTLWVNYIAITIRFSPFFKEFLDLFSQKFSVYISISVTRVISQNIRMFSNFGHGTIANYPQNDKINPDLV